MIDLTSFQEALGLMNNWQVFLVIIAGFAFGMVMGALPGVSATVALAAVIPMTYAMNSFVAIVLLSSIYTGAITGGSIGSILLNMPGTPGSVITAMDGFPMAARGEASKAMGFSLYASAFGCIAGYILFVFMLKPVVKVIANLGPADRGVILLAALFLIVVLQSSGSVFRALISCALGVVLGLCGPAPLGQIRTLPFGITGLYAGFNQTALLIGLLAFSSLLGYLRQTEVIPLEKQEAYGFPFFKKVLGTIKFFKKIRYWAIMGLNLVLGFLIGLCPGIGATTSTMMSYTYTKQLFDKEDKFGTGVPEGIICAETSNNAVEGGAMVCMMALGVPGNGATAILMTGFMIHGMAPGPTWIQASMPFAYAIAVANIILALCMIPLGAFIQSHGAKILKVPLKYLAPILVVVSSAGLYALNNSLFAILTAWVFAFVGYIMKKAGYPVVPMLIAFIMASSIEMEWYRVALIYKNNMASVLTRPTVLIVLALMVGIIVIRIVGYIKKSKAAAAE